MFSIMKKKFHFGFLVLLILINIPLNVFAETIECSGAEMKLSTGNIGIGDQFTEEVRGLKVTKNLNYDLKVSCKNSEFYLFHYKNNFFTVGTVTNDSHLEVMFENTRRSDENHNSKLIYATLLSAKLTGKSVSINFYKDTKTNDNSILSVTLN